MKALACKKSLINKILEGLLHQIITHKDLVRKAIQEYYAQIAAINTAGVASSNAKNVQNTLETS